MYLCVKFGCSFANEQVAFYYVSQSYLESLIHFALTVLFAVCSSLPKSSVFSQIQSLPYIESKNIAKKKTKLTP